MVAQGGATGDLIYLRRNSRRRTPFNAMIRAMKAAIWGDWTLAGSEEKRFGHSPFWSALLWAHHHFDSKKGMPQSAELKSFVANFGINRILEYFVL